MWKRLCYVGVLGTHAFSPAHADVLLRSAHAAPPPTVDELASKLSLTDNAVRARSGHTRARRNRAAMWCAAWRWRSVSPPTPNELTAGAEQFFLKPYATVLNELLDSLDGCINSDALADILGTVGKQIASDSFGKRRHACQARGGRPSAQPAWRSRRTRCARWPAPHSGLQLSSGGARTRSPGGLSPRRSVCEYSRGHTCTRALRPGFHTTLLL